MSTGDKIKKARQKRGISQKELAQRLGTSPQNLAQYESGKRNPKLKTIEKIAVALDVPISELIEPTVLQLSEDVINLFTGKGGIEIVTDYTKINQLYDCLNEKGQDKAIEQVELLTKIPEYQKESYNSHILVNAAHKRTDIEVTEEMEKHDDDIMNDEDF